MKNYLIGQKTYKSGKHEPICICSKKDSLSISPRRLHIMNVSNYFYFFKPHIFAALTQVLGVVSPLSPSLSPLLHSALID